jgi:hypothetical protein
LDDKRYFISNGLDFVFNFPAEDILKKKKNSTSLSDQMICCFIDSS